MGAPLCSICHEKQAMYVCQKCGRVVCSKCFEPSMWLCADCFKREAHVQPYTMLPEISLFTKSLRIGFIIMFTGFVITFLATLLLNIKEGGAYIILPGLIIPLTEDMALAVLACFIVAVIVLFKVLK